MTYYLVIYEHAEDGGWGAHCPDVDGVVAVGQTRGEVEARMAEALSAHLSYLRESGRPVPSRIPTPAASRRGHHRLERGTRPAQAGPKARLELRATQMS